MGFAEAPPYNRKHAFSWTAAGGMMDLGAFIGDSYSEALALNDDGDVVGWAIPPGAGQPHAVVWLINK